MNFKARITGLALLLAMVLMSTTGCMYSKSRYYDFRDIWALGAGITAENSVTGVIPPSLGLYFEATDFFHLGAFTHNGYTAETDLRGTFVGPESTTRLGFLWWQMIRKNQDYENALYMNQFKDQNDPWCYHMESAPLRYKWRPAKRLHYEAFSLERQHGTALLHRGWQYWEYIGAEAAVCEPFVTHFGVMLRAGVDPSEISDFLLGWFGVDFKHDDLKASWYAEPVEVAMNDEPIMEEETVYPVVEDVTEPATKRVEEPKVEETPVPVEGDVQVLPFPEMKIIYFDYDKSNLRADQLPRLDENVDYLVQNTDVMIRIEGHCDQRGSIAYNDKLGMKRAVAIKDYLVKKGIDPIRISVVSKGKTQLAEQGDDADSRSKNRRGEFLRVVYATK